MPAKQCLELMYLCRRPEPVIEPNARPNRQPFTNFDRKEFALMLSEAYCRDVCYSTPCQCWQWGVTIDALM